MITRPDLGPVLSPAYDMLCTAIVNPADDELALTLNGKKKKIKKSDFIHAFNAAGLDKKQQENILSKLVTWLLIIVFTSVSSSFSA